MPAAPGNFRWRSSCNSYFTEPVGQTVFLILPGVTADAQRFATCQGLARECWSEAQVSMPDYLARFRGVRGIGRWLDEWTDRTFAPTDAIFILAFVLGGAALPHAPSLVARARKVVTLRSRYQEGVPRWFRRRLGWLGTTLVAGRAVADLGAGPFWPAGFRLPCLQWTLVETKPTPLATRLHVSPLGDAELGIGASQFSDMGGTPMPRGTGVPPVGLQKTEMRPLGIRDYKELEIDHDFAYHSRTLMIEATNWLKSPEPLT